MAVVQVYGASDDLVEIEDIEGADEFSTNGRTKQVHMTTESSVSVARIHRGTRHASLPAKAFPETLGTVYKFSTSSVYHSGGSYLDRNCRLFVMEYLHLIADELSNNIEEIESPAVLIVANSMDNMGAHSAVLRKNYSERTAINFPYGSKEDRNYNKKKSFKAHILSNVMVDSTTGLHYFDAKCLMANHEHGNYAWRVLQEAFDFILIAPDAHKADTSLEEDSIEYSVVCRDESCKVPTSNEQVTTIALRASLHGAALSAQNNDLVLISHAELTGVSPKISVKQARAMVTPIIEHMLGYDSITLYRNIAPKPKKSLILGRKMHEWTKDYDEYGIFVLLVSSVLVAAGTAVGGYVTNLDFTGVDALFTSIPATFAAGTGAAWVSKEHMPSLLRRSLEKYNKKAKKAIDSTLIPLGSAGALNSAPDSRKQMRSLSPTALNDRSSASVRSSEAVTVNGQVSGEVEEVRLRMERLLNKWARYELDPALSLQYPLLLDASCEQTSEFYFSLGEVEHYEALATRDHSKVSSFLKAVVNAEKAFIKAEANAKKMRYSYLDNAQRKRIKDAIPLVAMLSNEEASPHEKISAYRKAGDFLEGIVSLPDRPIMGLLSQSN